MNKTAHIGRFVLLLSAAAITTACNSGGSGSSSVSSGSSSASSYTPTSVTSSSTYLLEFNSCGGNTIASKTLNAGEIVSSLPTPTRSGYTFIEWCTEYSASKKMGAAGSGVMKCPERNCSGQIRRARNWSHCHGTRHQQLCHDRSFRSILN